MKKVFFLVFSALFAVKFALAASATVGGVTYNYVVGSYWYDEETEEEYNGQFAVITGAKGAKGRKNTSTPIRPWGASRRG